MRLLITGSRNWPFPEDIHDAIVEACSKLDVKYFKHVILVHGGAKGADTIAAEFGEMLGMTIEEHPADWKRHGKKAGYIRNAEMADLGADLCLAFIYNRSRGATMMKNLCHKAGIPVEEYSWEDPNLESNSGGANTNG